LHTATSRQGGCVVSTRSLDEVQWNPGTITSNPGFRKLHPGYGPPASSRSLVSKRPMGTFCGASQNAASPREVIPSLNQTRPDCTVKPRCGWRVRAKRAISGQRGLRLATLVERNPPPTNNTFHFCIGTGIRRREQNRNHSKPRIAAATGEHPRRRRCTKRC